MTEIIYCFYHGYLHYIVFVMVTYVTLFLSWLPMLHFVRYIIMHKGLPRWCNGKEFTCQNRRHSTHRFGPWIGKILWGREWKPTPVFLPRKFHGQRSLLGYCII